MRSDAGVSVTGSERRVHSTPYRWPAHTVRKACPRGGIRSDLPIPAPSAGLAVQKITVRREPAPHPHQIPSDTLEEIDQANATGRTPVVFIHGLWLLPSSWDRWATVFEQAGYAPLTPGWPDDPDTVQEAYAEPDVFANKTVGQVADHYADVIGRLDRKPAVIGHSFGGLLTQIIAGRGLAASVAIDSAPFRGVLPLPISALRSASPVLGNPANRHRAIPLTHEQFRYAFANAVSEDEAKELFEAFAVPASGAPIFQAATANLNPWTEAKVDSTNPDRGPMLIVSGEKDDTVPRAITDAIFDKQKRNDGVTEFVEMPNRGHSLTIDSGWRQVADTALAFVKRFV
jgi:non-heme chloroperoxidase